MGIIELFLTAVGLSMDAFAVSVCKGLASKKNGIRQMLIVGAWFGGFQGLMPLIGYFLGSTFAKFVEPVDHFIAFVLLAGIGANMIKESFGKEENENTDNFGFKTMLLMAIATSIDALAVGIGFAMLPNINIVAAVSFIAVITFLLSAIGLKVGTFFGEKLKSRAEFLGGAILILMGLKILLEHLGIISF